jgi:putative ABC transport system permease protein
MGRFLLICRLAARDLRRRPAEAVLLLLAITAATTTLTLGLGLHGITTQPYQDTRTATAGPDVVAQVDPPPVGDQPADLAALHALAHARGVADHSGPYPETAATIGAHGNTATVQAEGRPVQPAAIDRPKLTQGSWVGEGGVVVERSFAEAFDLHAGDPVTLNGRSFRVLGVAVTAAVAPYPFTTWFNIPGAHDPQTSGSPVHPGLIWLTQPDARNLAARARSLSYVLNLKLANPAAAPAFIAAHSPNSPVGHELQRPPGLQSWQQVRSADAHLVRNEQRVLLTGSWLLGLLALASIAVLVGGRMADQLRRVGLLKAVGGTPRFIASVLLAEYLVVALVASAVGLAVGRLAAPLLNDPGAGLIGSPAPAPVTASTVGLVTIVALGVAAGATFVPAVRASRTSTVLALADSARPPRRSARLIALSARLPVPLLLGMRVAARRPRRVVLSALSVAVTVSGIVAALTAHAQLNARQAAGSSGLADPRTDRLNHVLLVITIMLVAQAAVNAICVTWATVLDSNHSSAIARALGATPHQVSTGLSAAQILPALAGAMLGIPGGLGLLALVSADPTTPPPLWWLLATVIGAAFVIAGLTGIPARISAHRTVAEILQSELA